MRGESPKIEVFLRLLTRCHCQEQQQGSNGKLSVLLSIRPVSEVRLKLIINLEHIRHISPVGIALLLKYYEVQERVCWLGVQTWSRVRSPWVATSERERGLQLSILD